MKELTKSCRQIRKTIDIKNVKIQQLRNELHQAKNRALYGQAGADFSHKLYLHSLLRQYHLSIFKDYVLDSRITEEERNEVKFDPERLCSYTVHDLSLSAIHEFLLLLLLTEDLLKPDEQELLEYSLNHRYLSYDIAQFSKEVNPANKEAISEAIDVLLKNGEEEFFQRMFEKVFSSPLISENAPEAGTTSGKSFYVSKKLLE